MKEIDFIRHAARRITLGGMCAVLVLGSTACHREMEAVDREAVNMLEMEQTVDASSVADEIHELESSREQSVADSIAESSREESQSIADSIAALEAEEASKAAEESARAASEAAAMNQAAQAEYLQQLVAGTNLVPNGVTTITANDFVGQRSELCPRCPCGSDVWSGGDSRIAESFQSDFYDGIE